MTFVTPWLLAGSALVAIPIVLHLVMRRKPRKFEFPAIQFVQKRRDVNQRRLRLRHLLLLVLRALAIVLLATALARPSVKFSGVLGSQEAPVAAALVFDTSKRMDYQHENRTRLEAAREWGLWLLAQLPRESQIAVVDTRPGPVAFQVDRGAAKHRMERLVTTANSRSLAATLDEAVRLLEESRPLRREVYVFTDMARVSWPSESAVRWRDRLARMPDLGVYLIDVGVDDPTNTALGAPRLSAQVLSNRSPLRIETEVYHQGAHTERTVELYLLEKDPEQPEWQPRTPQKRGQQTVELESGQGQRIDFPPIRVLEVGTHQGYVEISGQDGLACDDRRFFTVEVRPAWRVLLASPRPTEQFTFFLTQMLAPASFVQSGEARFDCQVIALDELAAHDLEPYAAVFLVDPTPPEPDVWRKLLRYVSDGGGLAVLLGLKAGSVASFNGAEAQQLLPGKLLRQARAPRDYPYYLAPQELRHPILAELRDYADSIPWQEMDVRRYWQLDELATGVDVVVPFNDGSPAILERSVGKGRVVTMTTPLSDELNETAWNRLPNPDAWPMLILVNGMGSYLVGSGDEQLNYFAGQAAVLRLDPERSYGSYALMTPDAPEGAEVWLTPNAEEHVLVVASTDEAGNYQVRPSGAPPGAERGFSVNLAPEQTRLDRLAEEDLADVFGPVPYRVARQRSQLESVRSMQRVGRELFPALILLLALALGIEHVLANRFYKEL